MLLANIFSLLVIFQYAQAAEKPNSVIRVRLAEKQSQIEISGIAISIFSEKSEVIPVALPQVEKLAIYRDCSLAKKCFWKIQRHRGSQIISAMSYEKNLLVYGQNIKSNFKLWPAKIFLSSRLNQAQFDVLAPVPLHDYLTGVLAKEMPLSWPNEALRAQVVASRSYLMAMQKERKNKSFDVEIGRAHV